MLGVVTGMRGGIFARGRSFVSGGGLGRIVVKSLDQAIDDCIIAHFWKSTDDSPAIHRGSYSE